MRQILAGLLGTLLYIPCAGAAEERHVRFLAFGDGGVGNRAQYAVGDAMAQVCAARGCDFALMLGDNFYPSGITSARDEQFESKFEKPYARLKVPIFAVLGNHDTGDNGAGNANVRGRFQVDYHYRRDRSSNKWQMPARFYRFAAPLGAPDDAAPLAEFFALDSNPLAAAFMDPDPQWDYRSYGATHLRWLQQAMAESRARWKIGFAHHPYVSNGVHGNAGSYPPEHATAPTARGDPWKKLVEEGICKTGADFLFQGHDHDLQWLKPQPRCGKTQFIVSGAVAGPSPFVWQRNEAYWQQDRTLGFFWFELRQNQVTGSAYTLTIIQVGENERRFDLRRDEAGRPVPAFEQTLTQLERQDERTPTTAPASE